MRSSTTRFQRYAALAAVLVVATTSGWFVMRGIQDRTAVLPGINECWRGGSDTKQIDCLAGAIESAAGTSARGLRGTDRDRKIASFVRDVEQHARNDARFAAKCHPAMHDLGRSVGSDAADAKRDPIFPSGSSQLCTAGYVHGLAEGYLTGSSDAQVIKVFPSLCHDTSAREGCAHGVGHALVRARLDMDGRGAAVSASEQCRELPADFGTNCMNGVFMELAMRREPAPLASGEFVNACKAMEISESLTCWGYLSTSLQTNEIAMADTPEWCAKATLPGQFPCIEQYGRDLGTSKVSRCEDAGGSEALRERCVDGAVGLQVGSGHVSRRAAEGYCTSIGEDDLRRYCVSSVARFTKGRAQVESS